MVSAMIVLLLFLILLFLVGKSFLNMSLTAIGGILGLVVVLFVFLIKKRRR